MDRRVSFIDEVEVITEYQLFQIRKERSVGEFFFFDRLEALWEMMGDSIVGDCDWLKWFVSCLRTTGLIWSMNDSQMIGWWLSDVNGEYLVGYEEVNLFGLGWVLCLFGGRRLPVGTTGHPLVFYYHQLFSTIFITIVNIENEKQ